jgi:hypothetical protein
MPPAHDTLLHRISQGGNDGRRAFLNLLLKKLRGGKVDLDPIIDSIDGQWKANWPEFDGEVLVFLMQEIVRAKKMKAFREEAPSQETMMQVVSGGEVGRRAFIALFLKAAFDGDHDRAAQLRGTILERIWEEQDRAGSEYWPEDDRGSMRFIMQEINHGLLIDEE